MANFQESATLRVIDQSSAEIRKINAELKKLAATAKSIKSQKIDLGGLDQASGNVRKLSSELKALKSVAGSIRLSVNASGLAQAQRRLQELRSAATRPITATTAVARDRGGHDGGVGSRASSFVMHEIGHAVGRAIQEGINDSSIGAASLGLKQLDPATYKASTDAIAAIAEEKSKLTGGAFFSAGQRTRIFSEALGVTGGDVPGAKVLTSRLEELSRTAVALGQSLETATEGSIYYAKAAEQMGRTSFHKDVFDETGKLIHRKGAFDEAGARRTFEFFQKLQPTIGKEMTGEFTQKIVKYLGAGRQAIPDTALAHVLMLGEEEGTRAAVGYRQAQKQLGGQGLKKEQLQNLRTMGLVGEAEAKAGRVGGKKITTTTAGPPASEEGKQFQKLIKENNLPEALQILAKKGKELGLDMSSAADAYELAGKVTSDQTARESVAAQLYRGAELQQKVNQALARDVSDAAIRRILQNDYRTSMIGLNNQLQTVVSEAGMAVAPILTPVAQYAGEQLRILGKAVQAGAPDLIQGLKTKDPGKISEAATKFYEQGGVGATVKGASAVGGAMAVLKPVLDTLANANILKGVLSGDPMSSAAYKLSEAGGVLTEAGKLIASNIGMVVKAAGVGVVGGAMAGIATGALDTVDQKNAQALKASIAAKEKELKLEHQRYDDIKAGRIKVPKVGRSSVTLPDKWKADEMQKSHDKIVELANVLDLLKTKIVNLDFQKAMEKTYGPPEFATVPHDFWKVRDARTKREIQKQGPPKETAVPIPTADPRKAGIPAAPENTLDMLNKANEQAGKNLLGVVNQLNAVPEKLSLAGGVYTHAADSMATTSSSLQTAGATFTSGMESASATLAGAGRTAIADMQAGAGGVGNAIGQAFLAIANSAHVNVTIPSTIEARVKKGPDTGGQVVA